MVSQAERDDAVAALCPLSQKNKTEVRVTTMYHLISSFQPKITRCVDKLIIVIHSQKKSHVLAKTNISKQSL